MLFFELLQIAIGNRTQLSQTPSVEVWREFFALAKKQAMIGIAFCGIEQLPEWQRPPKALLMQWYMVAERIKAMNAELDGKALAVANKFLEEGFPGVVLKGQGVAKLYRLPNENDDENQDCYPNGKASVLNSQFPISNYRTPGDIDIWLWREREEVLRYVRRFVPNCKPMYHHVDFPVVDGLDIEVHFTPTWMNSPITNRRLQRFFNENKEESENKSLAILNRTKDFVTSLDEEAFALLKKTEGCETLEEIPTPSLAFNRVYILVHIYRHLFAEGVGLRQLLDYYFVLAQGFTPEERKTTMLVLCSLRMKRFVGAVMWVLQEVYGMDDRYLLTDPNEREGRFLLDEIMLAGNFGQHDERLQHKQGESALHWGLRKVKRNFRFVNSYPSEVLWSPFFKLWHWAWRRSV